MNEKYYTMRMNDVVRCNYHPPAEGWI